MFLSPTEYLFTQQVLAVLVPELNLPHNLYIGNYEKTFTNASFI